jgi:tRNA(fMet)-specific endonuclease VapC
MHLLDTNVLTALYNRHPAILAALDRVDDPDIATTIVTKTEILRGRLDFVLKAEGESLLVAQEYLQETERLLNEIRVVGFDRKSIEHFESLRKISALRKIGRADLLIGCIALAHRATVVTRNIKDFERIPNLKLVNWFK